MPARKGLPFAPPATPGYPLFGRAFCAVASEIAPSSKAAANTIRVDEEDDDLRIIVLLAMTAVGFSTGGSIRTLIRIKPEPLIDLRLRAHLPRHLELIWIKYVFRKSC
jgi:hypothetical protein